MRLGSKADLPPSAAPLPEPADLPIVLLPDAFFLGPFPAVRLASLFGLATRASLLRKCKEGKVTGTSALSPSPMIVRLFLGGPYLAVHPLEERLASLVALLVVANQLELLHGEAVEAF